jgi:uncharacterized peroxidase-related enzyme
MRIIIREQSPRASGRQAPLGVKAMAARPDLSALDLKAVPLEPELAAYFDKCREKLGFVPNVLEAYAFDNVKLRAFILMADDLMLGDSGLSKLEREMIAVAVSAVNHCHYCLSAHGAALRQRGNDPEQAERIAHNYRAADLAERHKAMLDFAAKLSEAPDKIEAADRQALRAVGFSDRDIWDIAAVAAFYNMSNRLAAAVDLRPNREYHYAARQPPKPEAPRQGRAAAQAAVATRHGEPAKRRAGEAKARRRRGRA